MSKQDRQGVRTPADIERKYNIGKSRVEIREIATMAENTEKTVNGLDSEEIFKRLTNNGTAQGIVRDINGDLYIDADYIIAISKLFAKDITMSGTFTHTAEVFLEPGAEEHETIRNHLSGISAIPTDKIRLYDFNNDGVIDTADLTAVKASMLGLSSLASWSGAVKSPATLTISLANPEKFIRVVGTNMWGREVDIYIGANFTTIKNPDTEQRLNALSAKYIVESGTSGIWRFEKWSDGSVDCWCTALVAITATSINNVYRGDGTLTYPDFVSSVEFSHCNPIDQNYWGGRCFSANKNTNITIWSAQVMASGDYNISVHIKGTWE